MAKMTRITGTSRVAVVKVIQILTPAELAWRMKTAWNFIDVPYGQVLPFIYFFLFLMNLSIMFWMEFPSGVFIGVRRTFNVMSKIYNPYVVAILGPKISRVNANNFIKCSSF